MKQRILAFSSSRVATGGYLEKAAPEIGSFLGSARQTIAFVPFASVDDYEDYTEKVKQGLQWLPHTINTVTINNAKQVIENSDAIMIGGGNTFKLLHDLYEAGVMELIKEKVHAGTPYIGWSAGSNLTGPTICTTNDMPIIEPKTFSAFHFFSFQINPHYHNIVMEGFHGETRDQRLQEFLKLNPSKQILCLPEGTFIKSLEGETIFSGSASGVLMHHKNGEL
ncbi:MAG TPA: dipeptidase PepE, partial [Flavisolibacter sp.]|nr:dipeptidase PepE [Flavisolibacter sp.]